ncbi:MAG TPA: D-glycerate dehydrogenase [Actinomycetales bacterium]|jgi:lactate dehydrogenase-like 2-hydroxyacid dehydrogenase|nr:D-glycerate dehydrogenase [Actinomycetales bacterium]
MSDRKKILLSAPVPDDLVEQLQQEYEVVVGSSAQVVATDTVDEYADLDGWLTTVKQPVREELLKRLPKLQVVSNFAVGYDNVDVAAASRRGVSVCNTPGVLDDAVATLTIGLLISVARRMPAGDVFVREGQWRKGAFPLTTDLHGKVIGILGMGRIGRKVARIAGALGMVVTYHNRTRDEEAEAAGLASYRDRDTLIAESDFVSLHLPLTAESRHGFGAEELKRMKSTAYLVNTARGPVLDEEALVAALENGEIAGAALDVFEQEPLSGESRLMSLDNVVLQPHAGSGTVETRRAMMEMAVRNLRAVLEGRAPESLVNPDVAGSRAS